MGVIGSSGPNDPELDRCAVVFAVEQDVDNAGVSKNGSLGARGRRD